MATNIKFCTHQNALKEYQHLIIIAYPETIKASIQKCGFDDPIYKVLRSFSKEMTPKDKAEHKSTYISVGNAVMRYSIVVLPSAMSRNMPPAAYACARDALEVLLDDGKETSVLITVKDHAHIIGFAAMLSRCNPHFNLKTDPKSAENRTIRCAFVSPMALSQADFRQLEVLSESVRLSANIIDTPTNMFSTGEFVRLAKATAKELGVSCTVIEGEELVKQGFGGLVNVGAAAESPPALCILSYTPEGAEKSVAWVGKGITYDTGGLSLKPRDAMPKMKSDMAGAAAVLGAFRTAVKTGVDTNIYAILCLAENAVGPKSYRPDDILKMYSGKTVEINNTDAEGRLVLADGVAYASKKLKVSLIVDIATLTGAQLMVCGTMHGGLLTSDPELEQAFVSAGAIAGEPVFPMIYAPEILMPQFKSTVADMKNSVRDRLCASSSAAGHFIEQHISADYKGNFVHLDIAGPARDREDERGTAFGVTLLYLSLFAVE